MRGRRWAGLAAPWLAFVWQAQYTEPSGGAAARAAARVAATGARLAGRGWLSCGRRSTQSLNGPRLAGPRLAFVVWQAQYTEPSGGAAARVAAAGPRLAFVWQGEVHIVGWLSRGRRSTQSLLLRRAWPPLGRGWLSCGRRNTQSLLEELLRVWPPLAAAGFCVAGAVHRSFWRSWCARAAAGPRPCGRRSTQSLLEELLHAWPPLAFVWQAQYTESSGGAAARVPPLGRGRLLCGRRAFVWQA